MADSMRILVGLGNPGSSYKNHRHNVGYWLLDAIIEKYSLQKKEKPGYYVYPWVLPNKTVYLLRPKQYMNDSGLAVKSLMHFYKIQPEDVWVAYDEMDFLPGVVRVKRQGGAGGHNGIKSIISHAGPNFNRLRFGVDRPKDPAAIKQYVLSSPNQTDRQKITKGIDWVIEHIELLIDGQYSQFTEQLHLETKDISD